MDQHQQQIFVHANVIIVDKSALYEAIRDCFMNAISGEFDDEEEFPLLISSPANVDMSKKLHNNSSNLEFLRMWPR